MFTIDSPKYRSVSAAPPFVDTATTGTNNLSKGKYTYAMG